MKRDNFIRESLEQNLSGLHVSRRQQMDMIDEITGGAKMKRKMPISVALAAILILTSVTALAVGTNLFHYFANQDARYGKIAEQAANVTAAPVEVNSDELGKVDARIDSAYYDGQSLSVAFIIENSMRIEEYTPAEGELANVQPVIDPVRPLGSTEEEQRILAAFDKAVESGTPFGYAMYKIYPSDHTYANGIDLPPYTGMEDYDAAGAYRAIRDYETPLPEEVLNQPELSLSIKLYESANVHYFDGENIFTYDLDRREAGFITGTVPHTDAESRRFAGSATIEGITFSAEAAFTAMNGQITLTADQDVFEPVDYELDGCAWQAPAWELAVVDENGYEYRNMNGYSLTQFNPIEISVEGSGELPDELHIYLLHAGEEPDTYDYWPDADAKLENPHLVLKTVE